MYKNTSRIIIKKGYESLCKAYWPHSILDAKFEYFHFYKMFIGVKYCYYAVDFYNHSNARYKFGIFEAKIPKTETSIIELLDSLDYSNFLITKALIKQKLKSYEKL